MGNNNVASFYRHSGSLPFPCHLQLGRYATLNLTTSVFHTYDNGSYGDQGEVSYTVEGSTCNLKLKRAVHDKGNIRAVLSFVILDSIVDKLWLRIFKGDTGFSTSEPERLTWTKTKKNVDARGGVTETKLYFYGTANRCGLLVWERKKIYSDDYAKALTIAHYFVHRNGTVAVNRSSETTDIGFSVVVKIADSDGKCDISVEGPERHPVSALLYMFDEVIRSGIWKPSMCPHCGNIRRNMSWQSDSEDSDGGQRINVGRTHNGGRFNGHANGSSIRCRNFFASN